MNRLRMIPLLLKLKKRKARKEKHKVHKFRTNHIELLFEGAGYFNIDGDMLNIR